jgi:hypothetical protein
MVTTQEAPYSIEFKTANGIDRAGANTHAKTTVFRVYNTHDHT